jgi:putative FmdB family regulatory protein
MPTYEYECGKCGKRFEQRQPITAEPIRECPDCGAEVRRIVSGGSGFVVKSSGSACAPRSSGGSCCGTSSCGCDD